jgi:hypothetical protein
MTTNKKAPVIRQPIAHFRGASRPDPVYPIAPNKPNFPHFRLKNAGRARKRTQFPLPGLKSSNPKKLVGNVQEPAVIGGKKHHE